MKPFFIVALSACLWFSLAMGQAVGESVPEGGTMNLTVGQTHTIALTSNPTTGYRWQLAGPIDERIIKLVSSEYKRPDSRLVGAGGQELWKFQAVGKGNTNIVMTYVRPWEKDEKAARTASFSVVVK
jgi:inhibitor of cysteine peptidase